MQRRLTWSGIWVGMFCAMAHGTTACGSDGGGPATNDDGGGADADSADGNENPDDKSDGGRDDGSSQGSDAGSDTPWRYTVETSPDAVTGALTLARAPSGLAIAYPTTGNTLTVATWNGSTFSNDTATGHTTDSHRSFAVAPDGTPWVLSGNTVGHKDGSGWTFNTINSITSNFAYPALAVGSDGTPWIAAVDSTGVILAKRNGASWTTEPAAAPPPGKRVINVAIAVAGGAPQIAWLDENGSVHLTTPGVGSNYNDVVIGSGQYDGGLAAVVDKDGNLHLAYQMSGRIPALLTNVGGTWKSEPVGTSELTSEGEMRLVSAPDGSLAMGWYARAFGVRVAVRDPNGGWSRQSVFGECDDPQRISLAYDASSKLYVAHNCKGQNALWLRSTPYPADYVATCKSAASSLCQKTFACCGDPNQDCCIASDCMNPEWYCEDIAMRNMCGNATQDPSVIDACNATAGQVMCTTTPKPGATPSSACATFF